jgi:hypothetical protein
MKRSGIRIAAVAMIAFALGLPLLAGCYHSAEINLGDAPGSDGDSDTDSDTDGDTNSDSDADTDSDSDSDSDSDTDGDCWEEPVSDLGDPDNCAMSSGWPCMCWNDETCDSGGPCIGHQYEIGICQSLCMLEDEPSCPPGEFGMDSAVLCDTWIAPDDCFCVLSGCTQNEDCPWGARCVEPSCIPTEPGCPDGESEDGVCFPDNW